MTKNTFILQWVLLALALLAALVSLPDNLSGSHGIQNVNAAKSEEKHIHISSGVSVSGEVKSSPKKEPKKEPKKDTPKPGKACDLACKKKALANAWINKNLSDLIVLYCKKNARNPVHCIKYAASVSTAESSGGDHCYHNGCFGIKSGGISYDTLADGVGDWVRRYNLHWYKATSPTDFYPAAGHVSKFRYCTAENSSGNDVGCPNGLKASSKTFTSLSQSF